MNIHSACPTPPPAAARGPSRCRGRSATRFSAPPSTSSPTLLRDYLGLIREAISDGQRAGLFRADLKPTVAAKMFFGVLDEMATNWILSRRRYSLEADADVVVDLFVNGARVR